jgi:hypothetical protein
MNRSIYAATATAIACGAIGLAAQTKRDASQTPPVARITVIGCVEPADQSTAKSRDSKYKLSHAKSGKTDSTQATGTTGSASQSTAPTTYHLDNAKNSTLAEDVGNQVEIVAVIETDTTTPTGTAGSNSAAANEPSLKVETIRVISTTCPQ